MKIQILIDNINSWIIPYAEKLKTLLVGKEISCSLLTKHEDVEKGDILLMLSCERIFKNLSLNKFNLVVHESDLPKGKGWSPLTWQILENKSSIPITLIEATDKVDSGVIYNQVFVELNGSELVDELREKQGNATIGVVLEFINKYPDVTGKPQIGIESFYPRRRAKDSVLNLHKTLDEQFNLLRVCDNEHYPAYFLKNGVKYILKIYRED